MFLHAATKVRDLVKKLVSIDDLNAVVLENCWLPGKACTGKGLYVRDDYRNLFDIIAKEDTPGITIEGVKGIGKSMMIPVVLWFLLHFDSFYEDQETSPPCPSQVFLKLRSCAGLFCIGISDRDPHVSYFPTQVEAKTEIRSHDWVLIDGAASKETDTIAGMGDYELKMVFFISPRKRNRYSNFVPERLTRKVLSPWHLEELLRLREYVYPEVSLDTVETRYDKIGGVPRTVFEGKDEDVQEILSLAKKGHISPRDVLDRNGFLVKADTSENSAVSFKTIQIWPSDDSYLLACCRLEFASRQIENCVTNGWLKEQWEEMLVTPFDPTAERVSRGKAFEEVLHKAIPQKKAANHSLGSLNAQKLIYSETTTQCKWSRGEKILNFSFPTTTVKPIIGNDLSGVIEKTERLLGFEGVYGRPESKIFETVDAVVTEKDFSKPCKCLQYTTAEEHSLKMPGINRLWKQIAHKFKNGDTGNYSFPHFYFVVPDWQVNFTPNPPSFSKLPNLRKRKRETDEQYQLVLEDMKKDHRKSVEEETNLLKNITFYVVWVTKGMLFLC